MTANDQAAEAARHRSDVLRRIIRELARQHAFEDHQAALDAAASDTTEAIREEFHGNSE